MRHFFSFAIILCLLTGCTSKGWTEEDCWGNIGRFRDNSNPDSLSYALDYYLSHFDNGRYSADVAEMKTALDKERKDWEETLANDCTLDGVDDFMYRYPSGFYRQIARVVVDSLTFTEACKANTEEAYEDYLEQFPKGRFAEKARGLLEGVEERDVEGEERAKVEGVVAKHFKCMQENSDEITTTVASSISSYIGKRNSTEEDVLDYMDHVNAEGKTKIFETSNYSVKKILTAGIPIYNVKFKLKEQIEPEDSVEAKTRTFNGTAILNARTQITSLVLE